MAAGWYCAQIYVAVHTIFLHRTGEICMYIDVLCIINAQLCIIHFVHCQNFIINSNFGDGFGGTPEWPNLFKLSGVLSLS